MTNHTEPSFQPEDSIESHKSIYRINAFSITADCDKLQNTTLS